MEDGESPMAALNPPDDREPASDNAGAFQSQMRSS
jgi:hypothetical protein